MDWAGLMRRMLDGQQVTFMKHYGEKAFVVIDEACWLEGEEVAQVEALLLGAGAKIRSDEEVDGQGDGA